MKGGGSLAGRTAAVPETAGQLNTEHDNTFYQKKGDYNYE